MDITLHKTVEGAQGLPGSLILFIEKGQEKLPPEAKHLPEHVAAVLRTIYKSADHKGGLGGIRSVYPDDEHFERIAIVGVGSRKNFDADVFQKAVATGVQWMQNRKQDNCGIIIPDWIQKKIKAEQLGLLIAKASQTGTYHFDAYKTDEDRLVPEMERVAVIAAMSAAQMRVFDRGAQQGLIIGEAINRTRDLGNLPPIEMTPTYLANEAKQLARMFPKLRVKVLDADDMRRLNMGALLGVAAGSVEPPAFIVLEWNGGLKKKKPLVFVGKGITFDSGGISIKGSSSMDEMKYDMLGGGAVLGAMRAIAALNVKNNVVGIIPATENMPAGSAYRPGDILRSMCGKTIEVLNTDAEGRLILADALCYAKQYEPRAVVDLATLTGACAYFLGPWHAGLFGTNETTIRRVKKAAELSGDGVWRLPLLPSHSKMIRSQMADVKNIGGKISGAATAAAFLKEFVDYPWAHLDIAGTAWTWQMKSKPWMRAGATGYGVHLLVSLAQSWK